MVQWQCSCPCSRLRMICMSVFRLYLCFSHFICWLLGLHTNSVTQYKKDILTLMPGLHAEKHILFCSNSMHSYHRCYGLGVHNASPKHTYHYAFLQAPSLFWPPQNGWPSFHLGVNKKEIHLIVCTELISCILYSKKAKTADAILCVLYVLICAFFKFIFNVVFLSYVLSLICEAVLCLELIFAELGQVYYK